MRKVSRETFENANQSKEFAEREVILLDQPDTDNDKELALSKLKTLNPELKDDDIDFVRRFNNREELGYFPLKVVFLKKTIAQNLVEIIETSDDMIDWVRRGQTWTQRAKNRNAQRNIEEKNEDLPDDSPYIWEPRFIGRYLVKQKVKNPSYNPSGTVTTNQEVQLHQAEHALDGLNRAVTASGPGAPVPPPPQTDQQGKEGTNNNPQDGPTAGTSGTRNG